VKEANKLRVLYFLVFCCTASWLPIFADYLKSQNLSGVEIGLLLSVTPGMMFLVQPFLGLVADRIGHKRTLITCLLFSAIAFGFFLIVRGFYSLVLATVCMAVFYNALQPLLDTLSLRLAERDPSFSYGTLRIAGAAGWAFTGIIVGHFIDITDTSIIFAVSSLTLLAAFVFSLTLTKDEASSKRIPDKALYSDATLLLRKRGLIVVLIAVFLVSAGATTIWNFYSLYMKENGASASLVGIGLSFQGICELPFFYFSALIIRRYGIRTVLFITVFVTALRLLLYAWVNDPEAAIAIEVLHGISWSLFWVVCVESVNQLVPEKWSATGQSLLYAAYFGIGAIAGNFWTGYLYDRALSISDIFLLNALGVALVGAALVIVLKKKDFIVNKVADRQ
jgi:PPP family 3-phenylpropionic acid transporter